MKALRYITVIIIICFSITTYAYSATEFKCNTVNLTENTFKDKKYREIKKDSSQKTKSHTLATANTFSFSHKYVMQIKEGKRTTNLEYYLSPSGNYFATRILGKKRKNVTTSVMDMKEKTIHTLMENNGDKSRISMKLNLDKASNYMIDQTNAKVTPTGTSKTILGYKCKGYKVKGDTLEGTVWVTQGAGISFSKHMYKSDPTNTQDTTFLKLTTGLTLEMDMVDTSKRKPKRIHMLCTELIKTSLTLNTNDYKKLM